MENKFSMAQINSTERVLVKRMMEFKTTPCEVNRAMLNKAMASYEILMGSLTEFIGSEDRMKMVMFAIRSDVKPEGFSYDEKLEVLERDE